MTKQITDQLMMIRPVAFRMNQQTAVNNYYQPRSVEANTETIQEEALLQFDNLVEKLKSEGIKVTVFTDTIEPQTPDSIFPNNWVSFHEDGSVRLYPMFAENRRAERREDILVYLKKRFEINRIKSYTDWERADSYLEGTGSMVLDRQNKIAYTALSDRTTPEVLEAFCSETGYKKVTFNANQTVNGKRLPIYHTNVMMGLGEAFVIICLDSIDEDEEKQKLIRSFQDTNKEIIEISELQKDQFAGNLLQVIGADEERLLVMSLAAFQSLNDDQRMRLEKHGRIVHSDLNTIERFGGGSARCMIAEIFLPQIKIEA